ncbi:MULTISPECIES: GNAT family N-acetyltransferase [unclassified Duganella]|uniref:GNAT family N-acetyltransferase n=1 Tax=unclassified Duganella TaxID=2636909 RepID=UPI000886E11A|nr:MULTISPECIES: GNAT family N-acetyltransferase [unclassified Duganella]SDF92711.1 Acetyltransferase (GNAT) domain-containing protein [Duganella sp. OV458]SDJ12256.1 Acetyltransferase (GNAT) domain-containing protein [Duganella sp. OV510]
MSYHVEVISTLEGLDNLKSRWQELCAQLPENTGFFSTYSYLRLYLEFHQPSHWIVAAIYNGDQSELLGIFPLSFFNIKSEGTLYRACKPLSTTYAAYFDFAVVSHQRRQVLAMLNLVLTEHLKCDVALLGPLHESSPLFTVLLQDMSRDQLKIIGNPDSLSEIETRGQSFDAYFRRKKSLTLPAARYEERRLRRMGEVDIRVGDHSDELAAIVLELCGRNEEQFSEINYYRQHPEWKDYLAMLACQLVPQGLAEVSTLRFNGRVIASALCFLQPGRRSLYLAAYDQKFARHSPSKVLLAHMLKQSFDEKSVFCFGTGDYQYKRDWSQSLGETRIPVIYFNDKARQGLDKDLVLAKLGRYLRLH